MMTDYNGNKVIHYKSTIPDDKEPEVVSWLKEHSDFKLILAEENQLVSGPLLKIYKKRLSLEQNGTSLFFHPSMALLRIINILKGEADRFLETAKIREGDSFLDTTMGLGSDALIASWAAGPDGQVTALEASPLIYALVKDGIPKMAKLQPPKVKNALKEKAWLELIKASENIKLVYTDHLEYLRSLKDDSYDIVYFDPMFKITVDSSASIKPLKIWSDSAALRAEVVSEACRVAKRKVLLKERKGSPEFDKLGFRIVPTGKYSSFNYGEINLENEE